MNTLDLIKVGFIIKTHGFDGHLKLAIDDAFSIPYDKTKFLFLNIESMHIPFRIVNFTVRNDSVLVKLEDINSKEEAQKFNGTHVFVEREKVNLEADTELYFLTGYIVLNKKEQIGVVRDIQEFPQQLMAIVQQGDQEIMIPLHEGFIVNIDQTNKTLELDLPEGLLDLNN